MSDGIDMDALNYRLGAVAKNPSPEVRVRRAAWKTENTRAGIDRAAEATSQSQSAGRGHTGERPLRAMPHVSLGRPQPSSPIPRRPSDAVKLGGSALPAPPPAQAVGAVQLSARNRLEDMREQRELDRQ